MESCLDTMEHALFADTSSGKLLPSTDMLDGLENSILEVFTKDGLETGLAICMVLVDTAIAASDTRLLCWELTPCKPSWEAPTYNLLAAEEACDMVNVEVAPLELTFWPTTEALRAGLAMEGLFTADTDP